MAHMKSHIICILNKTNNSISKIFESMIHSYTFSDRHHVGKVDTPYELFDWINADPQFEIEYYVISTEYYKIEAFKRELATIKDKHIIWIV
jgi:hypothetical protein